MEFFNSISLPFRLWQMTCLSPFALKSQQNKSDPAKSNFNRNYSIIVIAAELISIILCLIFFNKIVNPKLTPVIKALDGLTMVLMQMTALVIFWESFRKYRLQQNFFHKISSVDFLMEFKIGIRPNYVQKRKSNTKRMLGWLILNAIIFVTNLVILWIAYDIAYRWWTVFFASYFFCSLRYYQISTCVDVINYRYQLLNQVINHLSLDNQDDNRGDENNEFDIHARQSVFDVVEMHLDKYSMTLATDKRNENRYDLIYEKLHHLRRVCRLLSSANHNINEAFQFSIPLIIANDFLQLIINSFWILRILLEPSTRQFYLIPPLSWSVMNFTHIVSLAAACHHATEEVI